VVSKLKNLAIDLSVDRFNRRDKQVADTLGHEATGRGRAVSDQCLPGLVNYLTAYRPHSSKARLWDILGRVETDRIAAAILSGAIHIIGQASNSGRDAKHQEAMDQIGTALERECRSARLRIDWDVLQSHSAGA